MSGPIKILWLTVFLPFATLPWIMLGRPQPQPWYLSHSLFHILYIPLVAIAIYALYQLAARAPSRPVRVLAWVLVVAQAGALVGHIGELIAVEQHGGFHAGQSVFDNPFHVASANVTFPSLLLSIVVLFALTATAVVSTFRARRRVPQPA